jgi:hypothetical protein
MIALLKRTSLAWAGAIASTFLFILAVIFAVDVAPSGASFSHIVALAAVTLYAWLFVLLALWRMLTFVPSGDGVAVRRRPVAMY